MTEAIQCKVICMQRLSENSSIEQDLIRLADQYLPNLVQRDGSIEAQPLSGDAGFRNYYRLSSEPSVLGVYAAPENEDWVAFMRVSHLLDSLGVRVPQIYAADLQAGLLVIEDLGDELFQNALLKSKHTERLESRDTASAERLYNKAIASLVKLQCCEARPPWLPRYTDGLLRQEMELFPLWFVGELLGYQVDESESKLISATFEYLVNQSLDQPQVLVHRDYHCRNLLDLTYSEPALTGTESLGVIDFQDAVWGPVTYDLVSLSRDCYVRWNRSKVESVRDQFAQKLFDQGIIDGQGLADFPSWFESMSAQRHLKVMGIFGRLALRDGKTSYLQDLPLVMRYLIETCETEPNLQNFADWIKTSLLPVAEKQPWYKDWKTAGDNKTVW